MHNSELLERSQGNTDNDGGCIGGLGPYHKNVLILSEAICVYDSNKFIRKDRGRPTFGDVAVSLMLRAG